MKNNQPKRRLQLAMAICESVGQAILAFREYHSFSKIATRKGNQLKSPIDVAAESWIISLLKSYYPKEAILSEETYEARKKFAPQNGTYWSVDPLDGTKSYCAGFKGFCIQIAFIKDCKPQIAIVYGPAFNSLYWAIARKGAYLRYKSKTKRIFAKKSLISRKTYIDNRPAKSALARIFRKIKVNKFLEMGSFGLKICKVAEGKADIFLKPVEFKIWDTAPGNLILKEARGKLTLWDGKEIDYSGKKIYFKNLVAASTVCYHKIFPYL